MHKLFIKERYGSFSFTFDYETNYSGNLYVNFCSDHQSNGISLFASWISTSVTGAVQQSGLLILVISAVFRKATIHTTRFTSKNITRPVVYWIDHWLFLILSPCSVWSSVPLFSRLSPYPPSSNNTLLQPVMFLRVKSVKRKIASQKTAVKSLTEDAYGRQ